MDSGSHRSRTGKDGQKANDESSSLEHDLSTRLPAVVDLRIPFGGPLSPPVDPPPPEPASDIPRKSFFVIPPEPFPDFVIKCKDGRRLMCDKEYHSKSDMFDRFCMEQLVDEWRGNFAKNSKKYGPIKAGSETFVDGRPSDYPHQLYRSPFCPQMEGFEQWRGQPIPPGPYYGAYIPPYKVPAKEEPRAPGAPVSQDFYGTGTSSSKHSFHFKCWDGTNENARQDHESLARKPAGHASLDKKDEAQEDHRVEQISEKVERGSGKQLGSHRSGLSKPLSDHKAEGVRTNVLQTSSKKLARGSDVLANENSERNGPGISDGLAKVGTGVWNPPTAGERSRKTESKAGGSIAKADEAIWNAPKTGEGSQKRSTGLLASLGKVAASLWKPTTVEPDDRGEKRLDHREEHKKGSMESWKGSKSGHEVTPAAEKGQTPHIGSAKPVADENHSKSHSKTSKCSEHSLSRDRSSTSAAERLWKAADNLPSGTSVRKHHKKESHSLREGEKLENRSHASIGIPWSKIGSSYEESRDKSAKDKINKTSSRQSDGHKSGSNAGESHPEHPPREKVDTPSHKASSSRRKGSNKSRPRSRSAKSSSPPPSSASKRHTHDSRRKDASNASHQPPSKHKGGSSASHHDPAKGEDAHSSPQSKHSKSRRDQNADRSASKAPDDPKTSRSKRLHKTPEADSKHDGATNSKDGANQSFVKGKGAESNTKDDGYDTETLTRDAVARRAAGRYCTADLKST